ncbi:hypothetical protein FKM82_019850 [Ascaphus truei]
MQSDDRGQTGIIKGETPIGERGGAEREVGDNRDRSGREEEETEGAARGIACRDWEEESRTWQAQEEERERTPAVSRGCAHTGCDREMARKDQEEEPEGRQNRDGERVRAPSAS